MGLRADQLQGGVEDNDGHGAVYVIIAVNENFFAVRDCLVDAPDRRVHGEHMERVVEMAESGREESPGGSGVANATQRKQARQQRRNVQRIGESVNGRWVGFADYPTHKGTIVSNPTNPAGGAAR
jgi:hypothetical protein